MDGFQVLRRLRERKNPASVLVLTAYDEVEDRVRGLDLGADDYLAKPVALPELEARLRMLARRHQAGRSAEITLGALALDTVGRRARVNGEPLDLTAREWSLLEYLVMRAGQVVSKDRLMQALWNWDKDVSPNALEVHMSRLRPKLATAGLEIRTIRGFGYLIEDPASAAGYTSQVWREHQRERFERDKQQAYFDAWAQMEVVASMLKASTYDGGGRNLAIQQAVTRADRTFIDRDHPDAGGVHAGEVRLAGTLLTLAERSARRLTSRPTSTS